MMFRSLIRHSSGMKNPSSSTWTGRSSMDWTQAVRISSSSLVRWIPLTVCLLSPSSYFFYFNPVPRTTKYEPPLAVPTSLSFLPFFLISVPHHINSEINLTSWSSVISNIRVDIPSATSKTASLNCYALAQHCPPGEGGKPDGRKFLAASEYFVDLEKDESDELWKIAKWAMKIIWTQGDASVMAREG